MGVQSVETLVVAPDPDLEAIVPDLRAGDFDIDVRTASTATSALDVLESDDWRLDCVVSALDLPENDGLSLLYEVRDDRPELPFFLYAAEGSEETASEAISADVTDYAPTEPRDERAAVLGNRIENVVSHQQTELELVERERQLDTLIGNLPGVVYRCRNERDWPMEVVRGKCEALTGYDPDAITGGDVSWSTDLIHPGDRDRVWESIQAQLADVDRFQVTYRIQTASGAHRWVEERGSAVYAGRNGQEDDDGIREAVALKGFVMDVTERHQHKQNLEEYETVVETVPDGVYVLDDSFCFRFVNDALVSMTDYDREELLGRHVSTIDDSMEDSERLRSELAAGRRDVATREARIERADGETFPAEVRFTTLPAAELADEDDEQPAPRATAGVVRDTSDRKERMRQLERQRERLTAINQLHRVQQDITQSLIDLSSREEMERRVCDRLAETESDRFAWIGGIDRGTEEIEPRTAAGVERGYLEEGGRRDARHRAGDVLPAPPDGRAKTRRCGARGRTRTRIRVHVCVRVRVRVVSDLLRRRLE
ncbi:PAS domain S-box protein [Halosolutus halophilus]|uniref:PAS domain-containing protein n=1 Tax=Halosolutus halophilus TaxID=1552990 RepID=UPI003CE4570E